MATNTKLIHEIVGLVHRLGEQTVSTREATRNIVQLQRSVDTAKGMGATELVAEGEKLIAQLKADEAEGGADRILYRSLHRVLKGQGFITE